jgi:hypothetical protein
MRRKLVRIGAILAIAVLVGAQAAIADPVAPYDSHPHGRSYQQWMRSYGRWLLGDPANPLVAGTEGDCGGIKRGVFFLAAPIDVGMTFECTIPKGTPILLSHAGQFAFADAGQTDAELQAIAKDAFDPLSNHLSLDGEAIRLKPIDTKAYTIVSQTGSFYDTAIGIGTGPVRTAIRANLVFIRHLRPGDHVIEAEVHFADGGGDFSAVYEIHVPSY